jgi:PadR family transcriptional regulator PadR
MPASADLLQGTLDLLILKTLQLGPLHGWGISKRVAELSDEALQVQQGSLYPALYRLEDKGWIDGTSGEAPNGRKVKFYRLTPEGKKALAEARANWRAFSAAMELVLRRT